MNNDADMERSHTLYRTPAPPHLGKDTPCAADTNTPSSPLSWPPCSSLPPVSAWPAPRPPPPRRRSGSCRSATRSPARPAAGGRCSGTGCRAAGYTDIDFVGTLPPQGCGVAHDGDNEGHGGFLATNIANQNQLPGWLSATRPDIVLMHLGTNDVWSNIAPRQILTAFSKLVDQMRASNPAMKILVAKIIPMNPCSCAECGAAGRRLQQRHPGLGRRQDHRAVADHRGRPVDRLRHGHRHLRRRAPQRLRRPEDVRPLVPGAVGPARHLVTRGALEIRAGRRAARRAFRAVSVWQGGYQGEVTVTNTSSTAAISSWAVTLVPPTGSWLTQVWNGALTGTTVRNAGWNGTVTAGGEHHIRLPREYVGCGGHAFGDGHVCGALGVGPSSCFILE